MNNLKEYLRNNTLFTEEELKTLTLKIIFANYVIQKLEH